MTVAEETEIQLLRAPCISADELRQNFLGEKASTNDFDVVIRTQATCVDSVTGRLVFRLCKRAVSPEAVELARRCWADIDEHEAPSVTRRAAAGKLDLERFRSYRDDIAELVPLTPTTGRLKLTDGRVLKQPMSNPVHSYMAGYSFERFERKARPTLLTRRYPERWSRAIPFFREIDAVLEKRLPDVYEKHRQRCRLHPQWRIPGTQLSTVTINVNYVSSYHRDVGDFHDGYSTLSVVQVGQYDGGFLVFPAYRVALDVREGDVLLCQSHVDMHGNLPIERRTEVAKRVSFVTYLKHKLGEALNRLEAPSRTREYVEGKRIRASHAADEGDISDEGV